MFTRGIYDHLLGFLKGTEVLFTFGSYAPVLLEGITGKCGKGHISSACLL